MAIMRVSVTRATFTARMKSNRSKIDVRSRRLRKCSPSLSHSLTCSLARSKCEKRISFSPPNGAIAVDRLDSTDITRHAAHYDPQPSQFITPKYPYPLTLLSQEKSSLTETSHWVPRLRLEVSLLQRQRHVQNHGCNPVQL